jgi:hypothetical protein
MSSVDEIEEELECASYDVTNKLFRRGLRQHNNYFEILEEKVKKDRQLSKDVIQINQCFQSLRKLLSNGIERMDFQEFEDYGFPVNKMSRLKEIIMNLDHFLSKQNSKNSHQTNHNRNHNNDENEYDDDFEPYDCDDGTKSSEKTSIPSSISNNEFKTLDSRPTTTTESLYSDPYASRSSTSDIRKRSKRSTVWIKEKNWVLGDKIGAGSFGEVFQCMNNKVIVLHLQFYLRFVGLVNSCVH